MKKIYLSLFTIFSIGINGQEIKDVFRYSQENIKGTARFQAMSGAFGALGGDLSAINLNPAAGAVFLNNNGGVTVNYDRFNNNTTLLGTNNATSKGSLNLSQIGGVAVFEDLRSEKWKSVTLGFNYDNTSDFDNEVISKGVNPTNSVAKYFLNYANGIPLNDIKNLNFYEQFYDEQQAFLGYEAFIINPQDDNNLNNTIYFSNIAGNTNFTQQNQEFTSGFTGKMALNISANYNDKLYLGFNLNGHFVDYRSTQIFAENNTNAIPAAETRVRNIRFENSLYTYGSGVSLQIGAIYKPISNIRLGVALNSPTWYELFDETTQGIAATRVDGATNQGTTSSFYSDVIIYEPYSIRTPWKATGSLAFVFAKKGLISVDYALTDYSFMKLKPAKDFETTNTKIQNLFTSSAELRIGAEYKIKQLSLRGGLRNQKSPYKDKSFRGDLNGYSAGLGYNFKTFKLDVAYSKMEVETNTELFNTGLTDRVLNQINNANFSVTLSADFN